MKNKCEIKLKLISKRNHCSQIVTGFIICERLGFIQLQIFEEYDNPIYPFTNIPIVLAEIEDKKIIYDVEDGYWEGMEYYLELCDYYFKRSFSDEKNKKFPLSLQNKIHPLGFNYFVTCMENPYNFFEPKWRKIIKNILGIKTSDLFIPERIVEDPIYKKKDNKIIFFTRLFEINTDNKDYNIERQYINDTRIEIIVKLKENYGELFIGGLSDTRYARQIAPQLITSNKYTEKGRYLQLLHACDIGIGSMGLHESIGWKTAEYIAAAKGIVNERFHYSVPGNFEVGHNYLVYNNATECIEQVKYLMKNPDFLFEMKKNNQKYYKKYMAPEILIANSISIILNGKNIAQGEDE